MKEPKNILIAVPTASGNIPHQTVASFLLLEGYFNRRFSFIPRQRVDKARNKACEAMLKMGADYLLFIDDDNPIPQKAVLHFLEDNKDIVVGAYKRRGEDQALLVFLSHEEKEGPWKGIKLYKNIEKLKRHLFKVDAGATGCMMIKRKVVERMMEEYEGRPFEFIIQRPKDKKINSIEKAEDITFCERAKEQGFQVWCDPRVTPAHLGTSKEFVVEYDDFENV